MILESDILRNGFEQTHKHGIYESTERIEIGGNKYARFIMTVRKCKSAQIIKLVEVVELKNKAYERIRFYGWVNSPVVLYHIIRATDFKQIP